MIIFFKRYCGNCGDPFLSHSSHRWRCDKCKKLKLNKNQVNQKYCCLCGKNRKQQYKTCVCILEKRKKVYKEKKKKKKNCNNCGASLNSKYSRQIYCTSCKPSVRKRVVRLWYRNKNPKKLYILTCKRCNDSFECSHRTREYCDKCQPLHQLEYNRNRYRTNAEFRESQNVRRRLSLQHKKMMSLIGIKTILKEIDYDRKYSDNSIAR